MPEKIYEALIPVEDGKFYKIEFSRSIRGRAFPPGTKIAALVVSLDGRVLDAWRVPLKPDGKPDFKKAREERRKRSLKVVLEREDYEE